MAGAKWIAAVADAADDRLRELSRTLKRQLRLLRLLVFFLVVALLAIYAAAVGAILRPEWMAYWFAGAVVILSVPFALLVVVVALPLRLKSVTRLIDMGYPRNVKELTIRLVARKLHDESIDTEELLVDTAINETRKAIRKYKPRVERMLRSDEEPAPGPETDRAVDDALRRRGGQPPA